MPDADSGNYPEQEALEALLAARNELYYGPPSRAETERIANAMGGYIFTIREYLRSHRAR